MGNLQVEVLREEIKYIQNVNEDIKNEVNLQRDLIGEVGVLHSVRYSNN